MAKLLYAHAGKYYLSMKLVWDYLLSRVTEWEILGPGHLIKVAYDSISAVPQL